MKLLRVTCKGTASTRAALSNADGAVDQRVSVSESPEGKIGGFKGERALCASAIMVDLRLARSCIDRQNE